MCRSGPGSEEAFEAALDALIVQAYQSGIEIAGGAYVSRQASEDVPDIEVQFHRLAEPSDKRE